MCKYVQTRFGCGHFHHGTALGNSSTGIQKCIPVKVALEYWHRQVQFLPIESGTGTTMPCPRPCRPVRPLPRGVPTNRERWESDNEVQRANMSALGIQDAEIAEVLAIEATVNRDSMRPLPRQVQPLQSYPINWYNFICDLQVFQSLPLKGPNVRIVNVERGCGRPGPPFVSSPCLAGWNKTDICMCRMREWNSPPFVRGLKLRYENLPEPTPRGPSPEKIESTIIIPISQKLDELLEFLAQRERGHNVQALVAGQIEPTEQQSSTARPRANSLPEREVPQNEGEQPTEGLEETMAAMETMRLSKAGLFESP